MISNKKWTTFAVLFKTSKKPTKNIKTFKMKKLFIVLLAASLFVGCSSKTSQEGIETAESHLISELVSNPLDFDNHAVSFEGTIGHICRHSGDKMRVVQQEDDAFSVLVMLGDLSANFNVEMEGQAVKATGILKTEVRNIDALADHDHDHDHADGEGHDDCASTQEAVARMKERGIDPDIRVYVELTSYEIK